VLALRSTANRCHHLWRSGPHAADCRGGGELPACKACGFGGSECSFARGIGVQSFTSAKIFALAQRLTGLPTTRRARPLMADTLPSPSWEMTAASKRTARLYLRPSNQFGLQPPGTCCLPQKVLSQS